MHEIQSVGLDIRVNTCVDGSKPQCKRPRQVENMICPTETGKSYLQTYMFSIADDKSSDKYQVWDQDLLGDFQCFHRKNI